MDGIDLPTEKPPAIISASTVMAIMGAPEFPALVAEYAAESALAGLPPPDAKMPMYLQLEAMGRLHAFSATIGDTLVGFISLLVSPLPHYDGIPVAIGESFFVAAEHRKSGAGLRLMNAAENRARDLGCPGILLSTPFGGRLFELLPKCGYTESHRVYFKALPHE